jgi:hypothetical protein
VVRVLGYTPGGPGSIPGTNRKKKEVVGLERGPLSLVSITEELLDRKVAAPVYKLENTGVGIRHADHVAPSIQKVGNRFVDKRRSLSRYSWLEDSDHGVLRKQIIVLEYGGIWLCAAYSTNRMGYMLTRGFWLLTARTVAGWFKRFCRISCLNVQRKYDGNESTQYH